ncbi:hypothetical protein [Celeribacter indicus]|uniref:Uncharacterized protein n=1 Tax=Celeribacter indicus TaxID=1208324 RepID=A0A0B5E7M8_9RHOB|nr:hypothetical protein [Celeribacter indicus]AJE48297.1 hypothetical protein P73_3582 [Celeribacter indicus]SDW72067.1 hypothetical protein SAMN05443573_106127 [Celeribacter indicus]
MGKSLSDLGIGKTELLRGVDAMAERHFAPSQWSGKVYLFDPRTGRPWDLKIALRVTAGLCGVALPEGFTSDRYRRDVLRAGLS